MDDQNLDEVCVKYWSELVLSASYQILNAMLSRTTEIWMNNHLVSDRNCNIRYTYNAQILLQGW